MKFRHRSPTVAKLRSEQRAPTQVGKVAHNALTEFSELIARLSDEDSLVFSEGPSKPGVSRRVEDQQTTDRMDDLASARNDLQIVLSRIVLRISQIRISSPRKRRLVSFTFVGADLGSHSAITA